MQYNMLDDGSLEPLPRPSIDTGAGLERVTMLAQGVDSAYLTDAFGDVIEVIEGWSGARYGHTPGETKALKVLADHGRAMSFLASDGIEPGNEGRGYVLRRVIRRAILFGRRIGLEDAFLVRLHARVVELLRGAHPELGREEARVAELLAAEEERFSRTLETGAKLLDDVIAGSGDEVSADAAFRLHDTYGFPVELTVEIAGEHGKRVDEAGFAMLMDEQRNRARAAGAGARVEVSELRVRLPDGVRGLRAARRHDAGGCRPRAGRRDGAPQAARVAVLPHGRRSGGRQRLDRVRLGPRGRRGRGPPR